MRRIGLVIILAGLLPALAVAAPRKPAPKPAAPDPAAMQAAKEAYGAMPLAERLSLQSDLIWSGDYNGGLDGDMGEGAIAAVRAFQRRNKAKDTGLLTPQERATLAAAVKDQQEQIGWKVVDDPLNSGMRLGIPAKLATLTGRGKSGGRWMSSRGEIQVETFRDTVAGTTFAALFEQQKKAPKGRITEYSVIKPDFFVLSGLQGLKKFYVRAQLKDNDVRGMTILYDQAMEGIMQPVVVAMSSAFAPFGAAASAASRPKVEYATAISVSPAGHFITNRAATDECQTIVISGFGNAERVSEEKGSDIALLRVYGAENVKPIAVSTQPPRSADLVLVGVSDPQLQDGRSGVTTASARIRGVDGATVLLDPVPAQGFSGAAALDTQGQFVGMVGMRPANGNGGGASAMQAAFVPAATIANFLTAGKVASPAGTAGVEAAKASVARVICVRK